MDEDGYLTEQELETIKTWDILKKPITEFLEFIRERWNYADIDYFKLTGKRILKLELHTGGWSGNEDIIGSLQENWLFWSMYWQRSDRGGHYYFKIPKINKLQ